MGAKSIKSGRHDRGNTVRRHREFDKRVLFQIEQWIALLIGMACLAAFVWAALDGQAAFSIRHFKHFSATALVTAGWFLTVAAGLIGVTLMRFAFYKPSEPEPDAKPSSESVPTAPAGPTATPTQFVSIAAGKRGR